MADPYRERILAALATRMSAQRSPFPEDYGDQPFTALIDGEEAVEQIAFGNQHINMAVRIEKIDTFSGERSTKANVMLGSLIKTCTGSDVTLGGLCDDIGYETGGCVYPDSGSTLVGAFAVFTVKYHYNLGDPETAS